MLSLEMQMRRFDFEVLAWPRATDPIAPQSVERDQRAARSEVPRGAESFWNPLTQDYRTEAELWAALGNFDL